MFNVSEESNKESLIECIKMGALSQYKEIISKSTNINMDIDTELLGKILDAKLIKLVVARNEDYICIGYFCNLVDTDWLTSKKIAKEIAIYVNPEYRGLGVYNEMLKLQEALMAADGVFTQMLEFQIGHNDQLPISNGYNPVSINYEKHIGVV